MIFCRATTVDFLEVKVVLQLFKNAIGHQINFDKSYVLFNPNYDDDNRQHCKDILGVDNIMLNDKYLGLPQFVGRSKKQIFQSIKERLEKKIQTIPC